MEDDDSCRPLRSDVRLRDMAESDLAAALALSEDVRWPHRMADWKLLYKLGSGKVAISDGKVVGVGMRWNWESDCATLGLVIVHPTQRGNGVGRQLMQHLSHPASNQPILLHATQEGCALYESLGFRRIGQVHQHQGKVRTPPLIGLPAGLRLRPVGHSDVPMLVRLDARARGMRRQRLITTWLNSSLSAVALDRNGVPCGFAILRRFGHGTMIGPLVAPNAAAAQAMVSYFASVASGKFLRIDIDADSGLGPWLTGLGLAPAGQVVAMLRGAPLAVRGRNRTYALANQSLG